MVRLCSTVITFLLFRELISSVVVYDNISHYCRYVLLKERNMLLTMQEACVQKACRMPNPDRIEKVAEVVS